MLASADVRWLPSSIDVLTSFAHVATGHVCFTALHSAIVRSAAEVEAPSTSLVVTFPVSAATSASAASTAHLPSEHERGVSTGQRRQKSS
jgi:hypothetical protein